MSIKAPKRPLLHIRSGPAGVYLGSDPPFVPGNYYPVEKTYEYVDAHMTTMGDSLDSYLWKLKEFLPYLDESEDWAETNEAIRDAINDIGEMIVEDWDVEDMEEGSLALVEHAKIMKDDNWIFNLTAKRPKRLEGQGHNFYYGGWDEKKEQPRVFKSCYVFNLEHFGTLAGIKSALATIDAGFAEILDFLAGRTVEIENDHATLQWQLLKDAAVTARADWADGKIKTYLSDLQEFHRRIWTAHVGPIA